MKALKFITILILVNQINIFAWDDRAIISLDSIQTKSFRSSDLVFLGELIHFDTISNSLTFFIIEEFKNSANKDTLEIKWQKHNRIIFLDKSLWIVYANRLSDSLMTLNSYALTRSINHPEMARAYNIPPPPPLNPDQNEMIDYNNLWIDFKINALRDWYIELELLRNYKERSCNLKIEKREPYKKFFYVSIGVNLLVICLLIYFIYSNKKAYR